MGSPYANPADLVPEPCVIAGTPLRPFCLGHHLLFVRLDLPFTGRPHAPATMEQLLIGVSICAMTYEDSLDAMLNGRWVGILSDWGKALKGRWWEPKRWRSRKALAHEWDLIDMAFRNYLVDGYANAPINRYVGVAGVELTSPWELTLQTQLIRMGYSLSDALNAYLPSARYSCASATELDRAKACVDPSKWLPVFMTHDRWQKMKGIDNGKAES